MSTALHPLSAYMEPPTAPDDTRQCASCRLPSEGTCFACGDQLCEGHGHKCDTCGKNHCRRCVTAVDDLKVCNADFPEFVNDLVSVVAYERLDAERRKKVRAS